MRAEHMVLTLMMITIDSGLNIIVKLHSTPQKVS